MITEPIFLTYELLTEYMLSTPVKKHADMFSVEFYYLFSADTSKINRNLISRAIITMTSI